MKQLAMLLVVGVMAFTLSACGEEQPKQPRVDENGAAVQPAGNGAPANNNEVKPMNNNEPKPASDAANGQESQY